MATKLYVGNLSYGTLEPDLQALFAGAGTVVSCVLMLDRVTNKSRGFAFIEMGSEQEAQAAVEKYNEYELDGRRLVVNEARPREARGGGRGFGGGGYSGGGGGYSGGGGGGYSGGGGGYSGGGGGGYSGGGFGGGSGGGGGGFGGGGGDGGFGGGGNTGGGGARGPRKSGKGSRRGARNAKREQKGFW
jgi:RNA recognition motif-containing protein